MISGVLQNASWLVTDRFGGSSQGAFAFNNIAVHVGDDADHVAANRARLQDHVGAPIVYTRAAHSNAVHRVTGASPDVVGVDALITDQPDVALAAQGADCVMLVIAAEPWIAAIHCGWRGLVNGVVPATLAALSDRGADLSVARAHLGPSICGQCYTVHAERAAQVAAVAGEAVVDTASGPGVDVRTGVLTQLHDQGVRTSFDRRCTAEEPGLYSYRRDGQTGRQAIVIVRRAA